MKRGTLDLQMCSPRLSGARGALLRAATHPLSAAFLGLLVMIPDGVWAALLGALLAAAVAWWAWSAQGRADRAGQALIGAASLLAEFSSWISWLASTQAGWPDSDPYDALRALNRERLGAPHTCLSPRLTPTPILTRASG